MVEVHRRPRGMRTCSSCRWVTLLAHPQRRFSGTYPPRSGGATGRGRCAREITSAGGAGPVRDGRPGSPPQQARAQLGQKRVYPPPGLSPTFKTSLRFLVALSPCDWGRGRGWADGGRGSEARAIPPAPANATAGGDPSFFGPRDNLRRHHASSSTGPDFPAGRGRGGSSAPRHAQTEHEGGSPWEGSGGLAPRSICTTTCKGPPFASTQAMGPLFIPRDRLGTPPGRDRRHGWQAGTVRKTLRVPGAHVMRAHMKNSSSLRRLSRPLKTLVASRDAHPPMPLCRWHRTHAAFSPSSASGSELHSLDDQQQQPLRLVMTMGYS